MQSDDATRGGTGVAFLHEGVLPPTHGISLVPPEPQRQQQLSGKPPSKQHAQKGPIEGEDNTNRKLLSLPPVVGSCMQYSNKSVPYRPFPPDIDGFREKAFLIEKPLLLDSQQIADYWPHVSNFYMRSSRPTISPHGTVSEAWECRIRRRVTMRGKEKSGLGIRQRQSKDDLLDGVGECKVRLNLMSYTRHAVSQEACGGSGFGSCRCLAEWLYIEPTSSQGEDNAQHTHSLTLFDVYKRSDALLYFCKVKVEEGQYSYAAVVNWAKEKFGPISSQLQHLSNADVSNVARPWRMQNREVELRSEIVEETRQDQQRKECLDSIQTTSAEQLRKALKAVCKAYPQAVEVIAPFMDKRSENQDQAKPIIEGDDIELPPPGRPTKRKRACDPPSPSAPRSGPLGLSQRAEAPQPYLHGCPQTSLPASEKAVRGFRVTLPTPMPPTVLPGPNPAHQIIMNRAPPTPVPPRSPYPIAIPPPLQFVLYPRPSMPQSVAQSNVSKRISTSGTPRTQSRPSWAQPTVRQVSATLESPSSVKPAGSSVAAPPTPREEPEPEPEPDIERQLRDELSKAYA